MQLEKQTNEQDSPSSGKDDSDFQSQCEVCSIAQQISLVSSSNDLIDFITDNREELRDWKRKSCLNSKNINKKTYTDSLDSYGAYKHKFSKSNLKKRFGTSQNLKNDSIQKLIQCSVPFPSAGGLSCTHPISQLSYQKNGDVYRMVSFNNGFPKKINSSNLQEFQRFKKKNINPKKNNSKITLLAKEYNVINRSIKKLNANKKEVTFFDSLEQASSNEEKTVSFSRILYPSSGANSSCPIASDKPLAKIECCKQKASVCHEGNKKNVLESQHKDDKDPSAKSGQVTLICRYSAMPDDVSRSSKTISKESSLKLENTLNPSTPDFNSTLQTKKEFQYDVRPVRFLGAGLVCGLPFYSGLVIILIYPFLFW